MAISLQLPDALSRYSPFIEVLCLAVIVSVSLKRFFFEQVQPGFEVVGRESGELSYKKAKSRFVANANAILQKALQKWPKGFQVIAASGPCIVLPSTYLNEIKNNMDLNFAMFMRREFFAEIPGFGAYHEIDNQNLMQDMIRAKLTPALALLTGSLSEEVATAIPDLFGESKEWKEWLLKPQIVTLVTKVTTRSFLGPEFSSHPEWLQIAAEFTINAFLAARELRLWPKPLRPIVHWFLSSCRKVRRQSKRARELIGPEVEKRVAKANADPTNNNNSLDIVQWMEQTAKGRQYDMTNVQLMLSVAAIHTTSDFITEALYDICAYPEYIEPLREEMLRVIGDQGWKKTSLQEMKLLDSFLKESQRLSPASLAPVNGVAKKNVTLSDGRVIPKGAWFQVVADKLMDPNTFPKPEKFDGYRFFRLREQPDQANSWQLTTTRTELPAFGYGRQACPGRYMASNEAKIVMCHLLLKYDWKLPSGEQRPPSISSGTDVNANPSGKVYIRRRENDVSLPKFLHSQ